MPYKRKLRDSATLCLILFMKVQSLKSIFRYIKKYVVSRLFVEEKAKKTIVKAGIEALNILDKACWISAVPISLF